MTAPIPSRAAASFAPWQQRVALAVACTVPGLLVRFSGGVIPYPLQLCAYGVAVIAAAFMLAWACEAAQVDVASGIVVAAVAFVAILPEYVVEVHYAFIGTADYVTANLTGASRLLLGFAVSMPALLALIPQRWRPLRIGSLELAPAQRVDLAILGAAALWGLLATVRGKVTLFDGVVLIFFYALYLWRVSRTESPPLAHVGVSAELAELPAHERRRTAGGLMLYAAIVILLTAVPFGDAVLGTGAQVGISPYLMLQWVVPLASETPELVVAFVLLMHGRGSQSVSVLLAGAVSQYTLALGTLPFAYALGVASGPLPLLPREQVELFLTAAVALFTVAALASLRLSRGDASIMLALFAAQFLLPTVFTRAVIALVFAVVAVDILVDERRQLRALLSALLRTGRGGSGSSVGLDHPVA
jgi:cation:H+ antiporter